MRGLLVASPILAKRSSNCGRALQLHLISCTISKNHTAVLETGVEAQCNC